MEKKKKQIKNIKRAFLAGFVAFSLLVGNNAYAASLVLSPASGDHQKNTTFSVNINVSSPDQSMNAVSGTITFPTDKLQVISIGKTGSIINFWAQEPSFSNTNGTIKFEGVVLTPGFKGGAGKVITVNFKGKSVGLADVKFGSSEILANDGVGTNIGKSVSGGSFNITEPAPVEPSVIDLNKEEPIDESLPIIDKETVCENDSIIYSPTHPGQIWRKENTAVFSWDAAEDVVASRIAFDRNPNTDPNVVSKPAIVEKKYENLADGVWYFHLSLQNNDGWSKPEHFKIEIDQTAPELSLKEVKRIDETNPKPVIDLQIKDKTSCVKDFSINIDGEAVDFNKLPNGNYELETIEPGDHELSVIVHDRAGNQNEAFIDITIDAIDAPIVKEYESRVSNSGDIVVKGETITNANLTAKITKKGNNFVAREDFQSGSGKWSWTPNIKLRAGTYLISFKVSDARGASSHWTEPIEIRVGGGLHVDVIGLINKIPPEVAMFGLICVGIFLVVFITRAVTMHALRKKSDWE